MLPPERLPFLHYLHGGRLIFFDGEGWIHEFARFSDIPAKLLQRRDAQPEALGRAPDSYDPARHLPGGEEWFRRFHIVAERPLTHNPQILPWLKMDVRRLRLPPVFYYELARRLCDEDLGEAMAWFWLGGMRLRYDAYRCRDRTAAQAIGALPSYAKNVQHAMQANHALARQSATRALEWEEYLAPDTAPHWICTHGIQAYRRALAGHPMEKDVLVSEAEWPAIRAEVRSQMAKTIERLG